MNEIKFRIAAKTDVGLVRTNNEDNFQAASDLASGQMRWVNNEVCSLGRLGALIVVADGMGGMNAGEVASELAIETIKKWFAPGNLTEDVTKSRFTIEKYMNEAIVAADAEIKRVAKSRPDTRGMGTTIVIGWVYEGKLYISWCGDSRAYVFNPKAGLHQISKDHSYVQSLVDKGALSREEAFDFPDSNIITRCLSDASAKAKPESLLRPYELCANDIILLCTDGLSGMLRDVEMESIINKGQENMDVLADTLIQAACDAEGSDNITLCLCQILQGGGVSDPAVFAETERRLNGKSGIAKLNTVISGGSNGYEPKKHTGILIAGLLALVVAACAFSVWWFLLRDSAGKAENPQQEQTVAKDSIQTESDTNYKDVAHGDDEAISEGKEMPAQDGNVSDGRPNSGKSLKDIWGSNAETVSQQQPEEKKEEKNDTTNRKNDGLIRVGNVNDANADQNTVKGTINKNASTKEAPVGDTISHKVKRGETYEKLSKLYECNVKDLESLNGSRQLKAGETIRVIDKRKKK